MNFAGSAPAMEPHGSLQLFQRSLQYNLRYTHLISDGDSKTFSLLTSLQPYGPEHPVEKLNCVGHVQKCLGTAPRNLKVTYRGRKLDDGKTIGGAGRLSDGLINSLQNYYGDAIQQNKGDLQGMVHAVQATLLHSNSTDDHPRHHLCPTGERSWCGWQRAQAKLLKPVYARLGNPELLKTCLTGYHQMLMNHYTLWFGDFAPNFCTWVAIMWNLHALCRQVFQRWIQFTSERLTQ